jgi:hypothetical protein
LNLGAVNRTEGPPDGIINVDCVAVGKVDRDVVASRDLEEKPGGGWLRGEATIVGSGFCAACSTWAEHTVPTESHSLGTREGEILCR